MTAATRKEWTDRKIKWTTWKGALCRLRGLYQKDLWQEILSFRRRGVALAAPLRFLEGCVHCCNILNDFISEACQFVKDIPVEDIPAWLEIVQHFGVPTRLLDFTENPLVALYFACVDCPEVDGAVWIINEPAYNKKFFFEGPLVLAIKSKNMIHKIVTEEIVTQDYQYQHWGNNNSLKYFVRTGKTLWNSALHRISWQQAPQITTNLLLRNELWCDETQRNADIRFSAALWIVL